MENVLELKALLAAPKHIVILSHRNPDGDAIGSSLATQKYLHKLGHSTKVVFPSEFPDFVEWMEGASEIVIYDKDKDKATEAIKAADMFFCLDFNGLSRIDDLGKIVEAQRNIPKVLIDHHIDPEDFADFVLSDISASSTCELVYEFIHLLGDRALLDAHIGTDLFVGILTDTGSFKYATSAKLYRIAADLLELGVDDYNIQDRLFNSMTEKQLRIMSHCLSSRVMKIFDEYCTGIIVLSQHDYKRFDIQRGDTEGIVNYILKIKHIRFAILVTEQPNIVKLSLRSIGDFSVQEIAQKYFKGGGHKNASGGISYQTLWGTVDTLKKIFPKYKDALREGYEHLIPADGEKLEEITNS
jgi:bifunctional oligoribonuclease and PAP phosphatase NrnA